MALPLDRIPPHNLEAERAVLGSCLLSQDALIVAVEGLSPADFYDMRYKQAFEMVSDMVRKGKPVDPLTFLEEANRREVADRLGGQAFVAELIDAVPTTANVEYHVQIVRDKAIHRRLIQAGGEIAKLGYAEDKELDEVLDEAERTLFEVTQRGSGVSFRHVGAILSSTFQEIEARFHQGGHITGAPSGFIDLDRLTGGFQPGSFNIIAARPSMGKTALALGLAMHTALEVGSPVLVFSLEMSAEQLVQRMLGAEARVNIHDLRTGAFADEAWDDLAEAAGRLSQSPIYIDDSSLLSTMDLRARCRRFKAKFPDLGLVVVDYLQLMSLHRRIESKQQEVAEISRALKGIARELNIPILALSQLSRAVEARQDKRPQLSDLRDSGAIEQDADLVMLLYRPGYYSSVPEDESMAELIIAKHRNGPTGVVRLIFLKEYTRFVNAERLLT